MQTLPPHARRRILGAALGRLAAADGRAALSCAIPVTAAGWASILRDASPAGRTASLAEAAGRLATAAGAGDAAGLRITGEQFAGLITDLELDLWLATAFAPARDAGIADLRSAILERTKAALEDAVSDVPTARAARTWDELHTQAGRLECEPTPGTVEDPLSAAFPRSPDGGFDPGLRTAYQVLALYRDHLDEIEPILTRLLEALPTTARTLDIAVTCAARLVGSAAPLLTLRTSHDVFDAIGEGMASTPGQTIDALLDLQRDVLRSATNAAHSALLVKHAAAETARGRSLLTLDLYKSVAEGQLRPWMWTLLRIGGRSATGNAPMLASLRDQALADQSPALRRAARLVDTAVRNAQAHEHYNWDPDSEAIVIDGTVVPPEMLADLGERAHAFMLGAETGWGCATTHWPDLAVALDTARLNDRLGPLDQDSALQQFAINRLVVRAWDYARRVFTVWIDRIELPMVNHCCQALIHAAGHLPDAQRLILKHGSEDAVLLDLPRGCIVAAGPVWFWARSRFEQMPPCTFLPILIEARLAVETLDQAVQAAVWLAANDVQCDAEMRSDASSLSPGSRRALIDRTRLASRALEATAARLAALGLPDLGAEPIRAARRVLDGAVRSLAHTRNRRLDSRELETLIAKMERIRAARSAPAALPTLDPTPIG
jgi:hypothetical protein